jgi:hypothetical protein
MLIAVTGAFAGFVHVLTGPDHLAAVGPLALAARRRGWLTGWTWGLGHASGVVVVAVLAIVLREQFPSGPVLAAWSERLVGAALIALGLWALRRSARIEARPHEHDTVSHQHLHVSAGPGWLRRLGHAHASFYLGILHGVAGSSHFLGVLPALALPDTAEALAYIGAFGVGTVAAMTGFAALIAATGHRARRSSTAFRVVMQSASVLAMTIGAWWLVLGG